MMVVDRVSAQHSANPRFLPRSATITRNFATMLLLSDRLVRVSDMARNEQCLLIRVSLA
jgi:hypothetical protein